MVALSPNPKVFKFYYNLTYSEFKYLADSKKGIFQSKIALNHSHLIVESVSDFSAFFHVKSVLPVKMDHAYNEILPYA